MFGILRLPHYTSPIIGVLNGLHTLHISSICRVITGWDISWYFKVFKLKFSFLIGEIE